MRHRPDKESRPYPRLGHGGFTLLELIIVVSLLTVMTGLVSVALTTRLPSAKVNTAARKLAATLRHAKVRAQLSGKDSLVDFYPEEGRYRLHGKGETTLPDGIRMVILDASRTEITEGRWRTIFFAQGGAQGGDITLKQEDHSLTIRIDPILGAEIL